MNRGRYAAPRRRRRRSTLKPLLVAMAVVLLIGCVAGGTLAWLTSTPSAVTNTFTTSDITITLDESTGNTYKMIPGWAITKDPKVTVTKGSEKCYVFVEVTEGNNFSNYMTYGITNDWTKLQDGVYYCVVDASDATDDVVIGILTDNKVAVKDTVTKSDMTTAASAQPTLTFKAYAIQYMKNNTENFTATEAYTNVKTAAGTGSTT